MDVLVADFQIPPQFRSQILSQINEAVQDHQVVVDLRQRAPLPRGRLMEDHDGWWEGQREENKGRRRPEQARQDLDQAATKAKRAKVAVEGSDEVWSDLDVTGPDDMRIFVKVSSLAV